MDMSAIPITFYSLREAATVLGVDYCTARGLLISGQLRGFQIGRRWRVQPADIQAFIDNGKEAVQRRAATAKSIHDSIGDAIKYYDKLILVCSKNALNSWWVEKELERVYEKERELQKERGKKFRLVIPIRIDDAILTWKDGVAATVKSSVIGDFTKWQDEAEFEKAVKELVDALNAGRVDIKPSSFL